MNRILFVTLALGALLSPAACTTTESSPSTPPAPTEATPPEQDQLPATPEEPVEARLERYLAGKFDSKDQSKTDKTYYPIELSICPVDAPELGDRVLYVEQALAGAKPYRQRLYVVERVSESAARSRVFELAKPEAMVGACASGETRTLGARDAEERAGCVVEMHWRGDRFIGHTPDMRWNGDAFEPSTTGERCKSDLQGATYATTEVTLDDRQLVSWDRGWDDTDQQVWGAVKGGYSFVRRSTLADAAP